MPVETWHPGPWEPCAMAGPVVRFVSHPNPPLSRAVLCGVGIVVVTGALLLGWGFLQVGAWPVFGFMGLEVFALLFALHLSSRFASAREIVELDRRTFAVTHVDWHGNRTEHKLVTLRTRIEKISASTNRNPRYLVSSGDRRVEIGIHLPREEAMGYVAAITAQLDRLGRGRGNSASEGGEGGFRAPGSTALKTRRR